MNNYEELKETIRQIIDRHCCRACDGYNCPNNGNGVDTEQTVNSIMDIIVDSKINGEEML